MSDQTRDDDQQPDQDGTPDSEAQEFVDRLRSAPAEEVVAELISTLLSTAQVKLGRRDARLFIDLCAQTVEYAGPYLPDELTGQVERALGQLRMAQVSAENEVAGAGTPEPHDLSQIPTPRTSPAGSDTTSGQPPASTPSKLWVPGQ
jgi:hypothetical protein